MNNQTNHINQKNHSSECCVKRKKQLNKKKLK